MAGTNTSWDEVLDGLDLPDTPPSPSSPPDDVPDSAPGQQATAGKPGYTHKGTLSPLIRTRRADVAWVLGAPVVKILTLLSALALGGAAVVLYAVPSVDAWWQEQTNPAPQVVETVVIDGDPVLYGVEDTEVDHGADFDPMEGVRALDPEDGDITEDVQLQGEVDTTEPGTHAVRYEVEDSAGNTTHHWRTITVRAEPEAEEEDEEPSAPRVSTQASVSCTGNATVVFTATGGGNVVLSGSVNASGAGSASGSATVNGGGNVNATATADGNVRIAYEWSGTGTCS